MQMELYGLDTQDADAAENAAGQGQAWTDTDARADERVGTARPSCRAVVEQLKQADQDFEWYPTTDEIIGALCRDMRRVLVRARRMSLLDIGAGNGKVLAAVRAGLAGGADPVEVEMYAIEKSPILLAQMSENMYVVGTDFDEQSLIDKTIDVTYCNPPYSQYEKWAAKIIRQSASTFVYLVIPTRWKDEPSIAAAIKFREATVRVVGEYTFEDGERKARAVVNLLRVRLQAEKDDAFDRFFAEEFGDLKSKFDKDGENKKDGDYYEQKQREHDARFKGLTPGNNYAARLVALYNAEMEKIHSNYKMVGQLDADLLRELQIAPDAILKFLKLRLRGLRLVYWHELFDHMHEITNRLTSKNRGLLLETLNKNGHVDFTLNNIYAVLLWMVKNANSYINSQTLDLFDDMISAANVHNYKSNQRAFVYDRWRYEQERPTHIALEYRLVLEHCGGYNNDQFIKELEGRAAEFLGDLLTVAKNLGFECDTAPAELSSFYRRKWRPGDKYNFVCTTPDGKRETLFEVRAFCNRNMHIRLNQKFALALNVEVGRLRGWIFSKEEAVEELNDPKAARYFGTQAMIGGGAVKMICG